ncbi:penicillin-binding protein 1B [Candidatus Erwinia haradaeae]|uniref:Penicillin-binding protein 1B n=1 Tax=Candidatus Erwinia haradaeae TaxID=1922217 RepID=A0A451D2J0_9GAMM|nr:penicillin-binding protein 1B [Candidatus Erwinia haradaeae]VFP79878.1 Penicillin-binding protein 1B, isoform gamma [Candidatus Erwinia haradaeae]
MYSIIIGISVIILYGCWLDYSIQSRINGKVWKLPAIVYSRVITLAPYMSYTKNEMISLLKSMQYRQVKNIIRSGEFSVQDHSIEMIRRPFNFVDKKEGAIHVCLSFTKNHLIEIKNFANKCNFQFFRLDPRLMTLLYSQNEEQRLFITRFNFPEQLVNILVNTEDRNFYHHIGINLCSIFRAFLANLSAGHTIQGGSTLTQQLVKNLFLTNQRSMWRKINEAYMAIILDARYTKDKILELYLNEVYLGQLGDYQIHGFALASFCYFGRPVNELSLDQQALLVGMVKGASLYHPYNHPKATLARRNLLLHLLQKKNIIDSKRYAILRARPLGVCLHSGLITTQPAFIQFIRNELQTRVGTKIKDLSGVKIFTTLDPLSQNAAEKAIGKGVMILETPQKYPEDFKATIVVSDHSTGEIHAMVGNSNPQSLKYNCEMQERHPIGSLIQLIIYLNALNKSNIYHLNTFIANHSIELQKSNNHLLSLYHNSLLFRDKIMLIDAMIHSINAPLINLGRKIGHTQILKTLKTLGIQRQNLEFASDIPLGALNLTVFEITQIFQAISTGGNRIPLFSICSVISENGNIIYQNIPATVRVMTSQVAYLTLYTMQQIIKWNTEMTLDPLYSKATLAGIIGTDNHSKNHWFAGIDGKEVIIIWVGYITNTSTAPHNFNGAIQIYKHYAQNKQPKPLIFTPPKNILLIPNDHSSYSVFNKNNIKPYVPMWHKNPSN